MELTYALLEPCRDADTLGSLLERRARNLDKVYRALDFIDSTSQEFTVRHVLSYALRSTWN